MMKSDDRSVMLADRINGIVNERQPDGTLHSGPIVLQALAIVAARLIGGTFDQGNAEDRQLQARVLGSGFATVAEMIWQTEAGIWPESGPKPH